MSFGVRYVYYNLVRDLTLAIGTTHDSSSSNGNADNSTSTAYSKSNSDLEEIAEEDQSSSS